MRYSPSIAPINPQQLREFLQRELTKIQQTFDQSNIRETVHVAPAKPQIGQVEYADGTDWNPGSGEGLYEYKSTGWSKL